VTIEYRDLLGTPFVNGGRNLEKGLDCWGLFMEVMRRFGHSIPDFKISCSDSTAIDHMFRMETGESQMWKPESGPAAGMAVVLSLDPYMRGMVQHYGVCLDDKFFIHTLNKTGVIVTRFTHRYFGRKIAGYYSWASK